MKEWNRIEWVQIMKMNGMSVPSNFPSPKWTLNLTFVHFGLYSFDIYIHIYFFNFINLIYICFQWTLLSISHNQTP